MHHTRDGKLVIQHRVLKAVEVLVSQGNERGGEFLLESSRVFFRRKVYVYSKSATK